MGLPNGLLAAALLALLAGAVSGLATWKRPAAARVVAFAFAVLGSLLLAVASVGALAFPTGATWSLPLVTLFPCTVRLDPLSAWFTLTLAILGLAVSVYSWEYLRPMERTRNLGALGFFYNALLLGLALVFTAGNAFFFLSAWEVMAVSAFCLVVFEHERHRQPSQGCRDPRRCRCALPRRRHRPAAGVGFGGTRSADRAHVHHRKQDDVRLRCQQRGDQGRPPQARRCDAVHYLPERVLDG